MNRDEDCDKGSDEGSGITPVRTTPAGLQVLTIFRCDKLEERPISVLDSAIELVAAHRRLMAEANSAAKEKREGVEK